MARKPLISRRALRVDQHPSHPLYMLTLSGDELLEIADVWRASRDDEGRLQGYQRPEVKKHVRNITRYLDGDEVLFPNPIILALSSQVKFRPGRIRKEDGGFGRPGLLELPVPKKGKQKPAWVVDGQQRMMAIAKSKRRSELVVPVNAFVAEDIEAQREHFIRVNSSKPLPRRLLAELIPHVKAELGEKLELRKLPSALCDMLNQDPASPFFGLIWRSTMSKAAKKRAVCVDTSIIQMLEDSLNRTNGCLFPYRNLATGEADLESIRRLLFAYWSAVREVWPHAWGVRQWESRLMHGAGIRAMGRVMDRIMGGVDLYQRGLPAYTRKELRRLDPVVRWTEGEWESLGLGWNQVMNISTHVRQLSRFLVRSYMEAAA